MKIITYYDNEDYNNEKRQISLACTNKIDYFVKALESKKTPVEIISPAMSTTYGRHCKFKKYNIEESSTVTLMPTSGKNNVLGKIFNRFYSKIYFTIYLLLKIKKYETIWCYHSLFLMTAIKFIKKIKKVNLILEVEEIYADVLENKKLKKKELFFINLGDKYIFPTVLLNKIVNPTEKPYVISHGTYQVETQITDKYNDGRIHCVYAGTLDIRKGGAIAAVKAAAYLNEKYHIHIIGFGNAKQKSDLIKIINEVTVDTKCKVTFEGLKCGKEYIKFLQSCHIGLSTQNPNAAFNNSSFPSKILSYLANGLRVVSIKLEVLGKSDVSEILYFYSENNPMCIAQSILAVNINDEYNSRNLIKKLDVKFISDLQKILL